jgi:hypothetical protein
VSFLCPRRSYFLQFTQLFQRFCERVHAGRFPVSYLLYLLFSIQQAKLKT